MYHRWKRFAGWGSKATVLGKEGQFVLVRHRGSNFRVHSCEGMRIQKSTLKRNAERQQEMEYDKKASLEKKKEDGKDGVGYLKESNGIVWHHMMNRKRVMEVIMEVKRSHEK